MVSDSIFALIMLRVFFRLIIIINLLTPNNISIFEPIIPIMSNVTCHISYLVEFDQLFRWYIRFISFYKQFSYPSSFINDVIWNASSFDRNKLLYPVQNNNESSKRNSRFTSCPHLTPLINFRQSINKDISFI